MKHLTRFAVVAAALAASSGAFATDIQLRVGAANVAPKSDNNALVKVESATQLSLGATLYVTKNFAVDILGSLPFKHDIKLTAAGAAAVGAALGASVPAGFTAATTKHLPPTISAQWHFLPGDAVDPYVGVGVNYTNFFNKETTVAGSKLVLPPSWGLAAELGVDFNVGDGWVVTGDVRYAKISTNAKLLLPTTPTSTWVAVGDVNIDPMVYGINFGKHFDL
jgi:outer membrane protein